MQSCNKLYFIHGEIKTNAYSKSVKHIASFINSDYILLLPSCQRNNDISI